MDSQSCEMDISAVHLKESISPEGTLGEVHVGHDAGCSIKNPPEFVNHGHWLSARLESVGSACGSLTKKACSAATSLSAVLSHFPTGRKWSIFWWIFGRRKACGIEKWSIVMNRVS